MCLSKQVATASDALWRSIALGRFPHLVTVFDILPDPKPPYKTLLRRVLEADRATIVSDSPQLEFEVPAVVTLDDYVFHYEIFIGGELRVSWVGKGCFRNPGADNDAYVRLPLAAEAAYFMGEEACSAYDSGMIYTTDWIQLHTTITDSNIKTLKTAKIFAETQRVEHRSLQQDMMGFRKLSVAHRVSRGGGAPLAEATVAFWSAGMRAASDTSRSKGYNGTCYHCKP